MQFPRILNSIPNDEPSHKDLIVRGLCDHEDHIIYINPKQSDRERLITIVHEMLHYVLPKKNEKWVERNGIMIGNVLWKAGYRSQIKNKKCTQK
jgi:hypothetical protein